MALNFGKRNYDLSSALSDLVSDMTEEVSMKSAAWSHLEPNLIRPEDWPKQRVTAESAMEILGLCMALYRAVCQARWEKMPKPEDAQRKPKPQPKLGDPSFKEWLQELTGGTK